MKDVYFNIIKNIYKYLDENKFKCGMIDNKNGNIIRSIIPWTYLNYNSQNYDQMIESKIGMNWDYVFFLWELYKRSGIDDKYLEIYLVKIDNSRLSYHVNIIVKNKYTIELPFNDIRGAHKRDNIYHTLYLMCLSMLKHFDTLNESKSDVHLYKIDKYALINQSNNNMTYKELLDFSINNSKKLSGYLELHWDIPRIYVV